MKTTILKFTTSSFGKSLVSTLLAGMLSFQQGMAMPAHSGDNPLVITASGKVKALSYFRSNSLKMMVHVENPDHEKVQVQIFNSRNEVIYQGHVGNQNIYVGKYNLESLPDGEYTLQVKSLTFSYSKSFSIQTTISREVKQHNQTVQAEKQEAI